MSKPRIQLKMVGTGVSPESVKASVLANFIAHIEAAIVLTAKTKGKELPDEVVVSLVAVGEGSNKLTLAIAGFAISAASAVSQAIFERKFETLPAEAHAALHEVTKQVVAEGWNVEFVQDDKLAIQPASITKELQVPPPPPPSTATGTTFILGRCIRVGGENSPTAQLRLYRGGMLLIRVDEALAKKLARSLYDEVVLSGIAVWRTDPWKLVEFTAEKVTPYRDRNPVQAFQALAKLSNVQIRNIDAERYVNELRGRSIV